MVVCFLLNPNWWSGIICVDCKMGCIRVMKSFSKTLERIGSRLIGLFDFTSSAGFPGLSIDNLAYLPLSREIFST